MAGNSPSFSAKLRKMIFGTNTGTKQSSKKKKKKSRLGNLEKGTLRRQGDINRITRELRRGRGQ